MSFNPKTTATGTHHHASKKPCTSVSYCSNARLWKAIQQFINGDKREEFKTLCQDKNNSTHMVSVILSSRLSNDPLLYTKATTTVDSRLSEKFGKLSVTDLNALEITLLQHRHDTFAYWIVLLLKRHGTAAQCKQFLNHQFGKQGNTALHLAAFWGMSRLVRLMLELGADPSIQNNRQLKPIDCAVQTELISLLQTDKPRKPSVLLKKAVETMSPAEPYFTEPKTDSPDFFIGSSPSPLSFSSSSSSSSSSLSSLDQHWTPPASPLSLEKIPPLPPSPAPVLTLIKQKKNEIKHALGDLQEIIPPQRSSCAPRCELTEKTVLQKPKKVRQVQFDPQVIIMDCCVRGDTNELEEWMSELDDIRNIRDTQNRSLLHIALMHGNEHLMDYFIDKVDINQPDNDGWTCLHYASALGLWRSLEILASLPHCDIHAQTYHGLKIEDCPNSEFGRRKCKTLIDKIQRRLNK